MKVELKALPRSTIEAFADEHGFVMEVYERSAKNYCAGPWHPGVKYYAHFKDVEVKDGRMLAGVSGNGASPEEAIQDYAQRISEKRLVRGAYSDGRYEVTVPVLTESE